MCCQDTHSQPGSRPPSRAADAAAAAAATHWIFMIHYRNLSFLEFVMFRLSKSNVCLFSAYFFMLLPIVMRSRRQRVPADWKFIWKSVNYSYETDVYK